MQLQHLEMHQEANPQCFLSGASIHAVLMLACAQCVLQISKMCFDLCAQSAGVIMKHRAHLHANAMSLSCC